MFGQLNRCVVETECCVVPFDDKSCIQTPQPQRWWMGHRVDGLSFKFVNEQLGHNGADGGSHGCHRDLVIMLTLEEEICDFKAEVQQFYDVFY